MKNKDILKIRRSLPNIREALIWADLPALEAEILLASTLQTLRTRLFAHPELRLTHSSWEGYQDLVKRRKLNEPIAYLIGKKEFYGLDLKVDKRALIPREETETLVLEALKLNPKSVADIGTGCGAIAVALATHLPKAKIFASDVSEEALALAKENATSLGVKNITFLKGSLLDPLPEPVDLIVANLPYIMSGWVSKLPNEIKDYEPKLALDGGEDGMRLYKKLFSKSGEYIKPNGQVLYELNGRVYFFNPRSLAPSSGSL